METNGKITELIMIFDFFLKGEPGFAISVRSSTMAETVIMAFFCQASSTRATLLIRATTPWFT